MNIKSLIWSTRPSKAASNLHYTDFIYCFRWFHFGQMGFHTRHLRLLFLWLLVVFLAKISQLQLWKHGMIQQWHAAFVDLFFGASEESEKVNLHSLIANHIHLSVFDILPSTFSEWCFSLNSWYCHLTLFTNHAIHTTGCLFSDSFLSVCPELPMDDPMVHVRRHEVLSWWLSLTGSCNCLVNSERLEEIWTIILHQTNSTN